MLHLATRRNSRTKVWSLAASTNVTLSTSATCTTICFPDHGSYPDPGITARNNAPSFSTPILFQIGCHIWDHADTSDSRPLTSATRTTTGMSSLCSRADQETTAIKVAAKENARQVRSSRCPIGHPAGSPQATINLHATSASTTNSCITKRPRRSGTSGQNSQES